MYFLFLIVYKDNSEDGVDVDEEFNVEYFDVKGVDSFVNGGVLFEVGGISELEV